MQIETLVFNQLITRWSSRNSDSLIFTSRVSTLSYWQILSSAASSATAFVAETSEIDCNMLRSTTCDTSTFLPSPPPNRVLYPIIRLPWVLLQLLLYCGLEPKVELLA